VCCGMTFSAYVLPNLGEEAALRIEVRRWSGSQHSSLPHPLVRLHPLGLPPLLALCANAPCQAPHPAGLTWVRA
jgi:hypothetical protein